MFAFDDSGGLRVDDGLSARERARERRQPFFL
jgi:hypothetical protein